MSNFAAERIKDLLICDLVLVLNGLQLSARRCQDRVDETTLKVRRVDSLASHKVTEVLVGNFEFAVVRKPDIFDDALGLLLVNCDLNLSEIDLNSFPGDVLSRQDVFDLLNRFSCILCYNLLLFCHSWLKGSRLGVEYVLETYIFALQLILDFFVDLIDLVANQDVLALKIFLVGCHDFFTD